MAAPGSGQPQQVIRAGEAHHNVEGDTDLNITGGAMVMSGGQRLVGPGGQVIVAAPGQQLVRTSGGEITVSSAEHNLISYPHLRSDPGPAPTASNSADSGTAKARYPT